MSSDENLGPSMAVAMAVVWVQRINVEVKRFVKDIFEVNDECLKCGDIFSGDATREASALA